MTMKAHILAACAAAVLCLGFTAVTPAAAESMSAHQASKMMRHRPMMMHHRSRMMMHKRAMAHHGRMMRRSM